MNLHEANIRAIAKKLEFAQPYEIESIVDERGRHYTVSNYMQFKEATIIEKI